MTPSEKLIIKWSKIDQSKKYKYWTGEIKTGLEWMNCDRLNGSIDPMNLTLVEEERPSVEFNQTTKIPILCFDYVNLQKEKRQLLEELMKEPPLSELIFDLILNRIKEIHKLLRDDHESRQ